MSGRSGSYENETCSKRTSPRARSPVRRSAVVSGPSGTCSSASSSSKTRSAEATPLWSRFIIDATWVSGWVNCRLYWMNACTSPSETAPLATRSPPSTAITT